MTPINITWVPSVTQLMLDPTSNIYAWLTKPFSLTTALRKTCQSLHVQVNQQTLASATKEEQTWLNIQEHDSFIRDVYLVGDNIKMVHARVIAPHSTYIFFKNELDNLGTNFIGETFLFKQTYVRSEFKYTVINNNFARRSLFNINSKDLMITEIILSTIPPYPQST